MSWKQEDAETQGAPNNGYGMPSWQLLSNIGQSRHEGNYCWGIEEGTGRKVEWDDEDDWIKITEPEE